MTSFSWLNSMKAIYSSSKEPPKPSISLTTAALISTGYTLLYVIPFYLSKTTRPSPSLSRDSPAVIKARVRSICFSCLASGLSTVYVLTQIQHASSPLTLHMLGFWPVNILGVGKTILLVSILFLGPLFEAAFADKRLRDWLNGSAWRETFSTWIGWRNFVAGPVSEEVVFRSFLVPLHMLANVSPVTMVFVTPFYFGIAHAHHFYEFRLTNPRVPVLPAVLRSLFQFTYTSVFGWFATFIFLRTGSVYAAIAAHVFCNWMGLPRFRGRVTVEQGGEELLKKKSDDDEDGTKIKPVIDSQSHIAWSIASYSLLVAGAFGFYKTLWPLTESGKTALVSF